ncbi:MAG: rod shape-determining protein MreC [Syntrophaceae bacterium]|nr:rod shape-determining protein MreC [Syntrophaceae bacterium]
MKRSPKKKYSLIVLALFFVLVLAFFSYQLRTSQAPSLLRKVVIEITAPLELIISKSLTGIENIWSRYLFLYGLTEENCRLRETNARLARKVIEYRAAHLENIRLRNLLLFREKLDYKTTAAGIIRRDTAGIMKTLMIDRGASDGIKKGQPVIVEAGLVGRVIETTWHTARVLTITDGSSNVDALILRTRANGIVQGTGARDCDLKYIVKTETVQKGDLVLTSGLGGMFPKELIVGIVRNVGNSKTSMFQDIEVMPVVDFQIMEEVLVITGKW